MGPFIVVVGAPRAGNRSGGGIQRNGGDDVELVGLKNWPTDGMVNGQNTSVDGMAFEAGTVTYRTLEGERRLIPSVIRVPDEMIAKAKPKAGKAKRK